MSTQESARSGFAPFLGALTWAKRTGGLHIPSFGRCGAFLECRVPHTSPGFGLCGSFRHNNSASGCPILSPAVGERVGRQTFPRALRRVGRWPGQHPAQIQKITVGCPVQAKLERGFSSGPPTTWVPHPCRPSFGRQGGIQETASPTRPPHDTARKFFRNRSGSPSGSSSSTATWVFLHTGTARASNLRPLAVSVMTRLRRSAGPALTFTKPRRSNGFRAAVNVVRSIPRSDATAPISGGCGRFSDIISENCPLVSPIGRSASSKRRASALAARCT